MTRPSAGICEACRNLRPLEELIAYWRRGEPGRVRYACRPSLPPAGATPTPCFRATVAGSGRHAIAIASALDEPAGSGRPAPRGKAQPWLSTYVSAGKAETVPA